MDFFVTGKSTKMDETGGEQKCLGGNPKKVILAETSTLS
jgi:hypothetical protein